MIRLLTEIALAAGTWVWWWGVFVAVGMLLRRLVRLAVRDFDGLLLTFWFGWVFVIILLQLWHLMFPVDARCRLLVHGLALAGVMAGWRDLRATWAEISLPTSRRTWLFAAIFVGFLLLLANDAMSAPALYDTGVYHLRIVRWTEAYPLVVGLANLQRALAVNQSHFLYVALVDAGAWGDESYRLANGLLLLAVFLPVLLGTRGLRHDAEPQRERFFWIHLFLLPPLVNQAVRVYVPCPTPDLAVMCVGLVQFLFLLRLSAAKAEEERREALVAVALLAAVGTTVKLSFLALGWATLLAAALLAARQRPSGGVWVRTGSTVAALIVVAVVPWWTRGVLSNGYPMYPSVRGAFPVSWRLPEVCVRNSFDRIQSWARNPGHYWGDVLGSWAWLAPWAERMGHKFQEVVIPLGLVLAGGLLLLCREDERVRTTPRRSVALLAAPAAVSLVFWFLTAPDERFSLASFWILGSLLAGAGVAGSRLRQVRPAAWVAVVVLVLLPLRHAPLARALQPTPAPVLDRYQTDSGLLLTVPRHDAHCWNAPLLCTPQPKKGLRLRDGRHRRSGFVVDWHNPEQECGS